MSSSSYDFSSVQKKPLKLKGDDGKISKKKKKKQKKKDKMKIEKVDLQSVEDTEAPKQIVYSKLTPAERKFKETQEKRSLERILNKASKSHKERVEEFNMHLDSLSEHYDIPKVSWTK